MPLGWYLALLEKVPLEWYERLLNLGTRQSNGSNSPQLKGSLSLENKLIGQLEAFSSGSSPSWLT